MAGKSDKSQQVPPAEAITPVSNLSARELEVAGYYAKGHTSRQIAQTLFISPATVRNHIATVYRKLNVRNKVELVNAMVVLSEHRPGYDAGPQQNVPKPEPVPASQIHRDVSPNRPLPKALTVPTIAVLPFSNMSGDTEQDFFCSGMSEDIITELSRFRDLAVTDRASSFAIGARQTALCEIRDKLGVRYVVRGSVRRYGSRIRVTSQLVDTDSEKEIWAERYDRHISDIFAVQDALVSTISTTIVGWMERRGRERARLKPTSSLEAYELVIQGRAHFFRMLREHNIKARSYFEKSIELDPDYSSAYTWLAETHLGDWAGGWTRDPAKSLQTGLEYALKASWLDDTDSRSHAALGRAYTWLCKFDAARFHFDRALDLNPNDTWALTSSARCFILAGRPAEGFEQVSKAAKLSPLLGLNYQFGIANYAIGQYREAVRVLRAVRDPIDLVHAWLAASLARLGLREEAAAAGRNFRKSFNSRSREVGMAARQEPAEFLLERYPFVHDSERTGFIKSLRVAGIVS